MCFTLATFILLDGFEFNWWEKGGGLFQTCLKEPIRTAFTVSCSRLV